jgi:hypothetical protein
MRFLLVFRISLALTVVIGAFMPLTWKAARNFYAVAAFWVTALLVHVAWFLIPRLASFAPAARWISIMWLGAMLAAIVLTIPFALLSGFSQRLNLTLCSACLPGVYAACCALSGIVLAGTSTASFVVRQEDIRIPGLAPGLDGFRIANLGDVHIGRFIDANELRRGIEAINDLHVDLLVVTGDLVDDVDQLEETMRALEMSNAPRNIIAILGNHEEMADLARILAIYREHQARITLLVNENTAIARGGATLYIAGVNFPMNPRGRHVLSRAAQRAAMSAQANLAFADIAQGETIVALSHNPEFFPFAVSHGAQLTLASHTHGGQLRLFGRPFIDVYRYLQGVYREGGAYLDVSAGFGHWLPIRFGVPREIVIDSLHGEG